MTSLLSLKQYAEFKYKLNKSLSIIDKELSIRCLKKIYGIDVSNFDGNIGQVSSIKDNYGFIVNAEYPSGIYFLNYNKN